MNIRDKLLLMKQLEAANMKSIDRYLKMQDDASIYAIIRREAKIQTELKHLVKGWIVDAEPEKKEGGEAEC